MQYIPALFYIYFCVHSVCFLRTFISEFRLSFVPNDFPSDCVFLIDFPSDCFCDVLSRVLKLQAMNGPIPPRLSLPARPRAHAAAAQPHAAAATSTLERVLALPLRV